MPSALEEVLLLFLFSFGLIWFGYFVFVFIFRSALNALSLAVSVANNLLILRLTPIKRLHQFIVFLRAFIGH